MKKQYRLLIETAEFPKGTVATQYEDSKRYNIINPDAQTIYMSLHRFQVEDRPTVWELITQEPVEEKVENKYFPFVPTQNEDYWVVDDRGTTIRYTNFSTAHGNKHASQGVFRTEKAARMEALRRESMSKRWKPDLKEEYFFYHFTAGSIENLRWLNDVIDIPNFFIGNVHRTNEEAKQWADRYAEAWRVLL